jgi:hypothetical protein
MRLPTKIHCIILFICILLNLRLVAQPIANDSLPTGPAYSNALREYHSYLNPEPALYRGSQYVEYGFLLQEGHPYFGEDRMRIGTVWYDGILYENLHLLYDEVKDQVVIPDPDRVFKIFLINDEVDGFTIENHRFIRLSDSLNPSQPRNGFYEQLYKGRISLLKKEIKLITEDLTNSQEGIRRYISINISYYIKRGEAYHSVNSKRSLLYALKDKAKEARKFIRKNHLKIRGDGKEDALKKVVAWYDSLNN